MSWARIDDGFVDHPKVIGLDLAAVGLWTLCLCYTRARNDPVVPRGLPNRFEPVRGSELAALLVDVGLWEFHPHGWTVHDWELYGATEALHERQRRLGKRSAEVRRERYGTAQPSNRFVERSPNAPNPIPIPIPVKSVLPTVEHCREVDAVFGAWVESTGKPQAKLTRERKAKIEARLREYPMDDVLDAVRGWERDPWSERVRHNDLTVLLRNGAQLERFRDLWRNGAPTVRQTPPQSASERMRHEQSQVLARVTG